MKGGVAVGGESAGQKRKSSCPLFRLDPVSIPSTPERSIELIPDAGIRRPRVQARHRPQHEAVSLSCGSRTDNTFPKTNVSKCVIVSRCRPGIHSLSGYQFHCAVRISGGRGQRRITVPGLPRKATGWDRGGISSIFHYDGNYGDRARTLV